MQLYTYTVGPFAENTYLLINDTEAVLIDPGFSQKFEADAFCQHLKEAGASLEAVILTHAHVDHVLGLQQVLAQHPVPVYLNNTDRYLWNNFASQAQMFGLEARDFDFEPENMPAQKDWSLGSFSFDARYTPGHAPDHISLYNAEEHFVIAGDALFREGIGRTDLYKGSMDALKKSIREQLFSLPDDTKVYAGHGPSTTIGHEKKANPFLNG